MASRRPALRRRAGVAFIATGTAMATAALTLLPSASASSHREAPLIANFPAVDNTDVYAFTSPDRDDTVTLIASWAPFSEPNGGPNFYPWAEGAHYDINIDSDGDATPDITYRWIFTDQDSRGPDTSFLYNIGPVETLDSENLLFKQTYDLIEIREDGTETVLLEDQLAAPSNVGPASMPDYQALVDEASVGFRDEGVSFAGQADDAFFLDLRVFDLLYGGDLSEVGQDTLGGYNTNTLAIQVPKAHLALNLDAERNPVIGVWSETDQQSLDLAPAGESMRTGDHVQISRLGNPLVNELVVPGGLRDAFNGITPDQDADIQPVVDAVLDPELPKLIEQIYGIEAPEAPRNDIFEIFLTGIFDDGTETDEIPVDLNSQMLNADVNPDEFRPSEMTRLNMSIPVTEEPNRLGVIGGDLQGFPNGRRLTDDVVDIEIQALEGAVRTGEIVEPLAAGDAVDVNNKPYLDRFPYVATANNEGVNTSGAGTAHSGGAGVPPAGTSGPGGIDFPSAPVVTGVAALALLGTGVFMLRRRPDFVPARGNTVPVTE